MMDSYGVDAAQVATTHIYKIHFVHTLSKLHTGSFHARGINFK